MGERMKLLNRVIDELGGRWADRDLDAVLFPAGYFRVEGQFGPVECESAWKIDPLPGDIGVQK